MSTLSQGGATVICIRVETCANSGEQISTIVRTAQHSLGRVVHCATPLMSSFLCKTKRRISFSGPSRIGTKYPAAQTVVKAAESQLNSRRPRPRRGARVEGLNGRLYKPGYPKEVAHASTSPLSWQTSLLPAKPDSKSFNFFPCFS